MGIDITDAQSGLPNQQPSHPYQGLHQLGAAAPYRWQFPSSDNQVPSQMPAGKSRVPATQGTDEYERRSDEKFNTVTRVHFPACGINCDYWPKGMVDQTIWNTTTTKYWPSLATRQYWLDLNLGRGQYWTKPACGQYWPPLVCLWAVFPSQVIIGGRGHY